LQYLAPLLSRAGEVIIKQLRNSAFLAIVKIKFKDFQGPYEGYIRRTKVHQTGTFISGAKMILCTFEVRKKPSGTPFSVSTGSVMAF